jgi:hypothetical protein
MVPSRSCLRQHLIANFFLSGSWQNIWLSLFLCDSPPSRKIYEFYLCVVFHRRVSACAKIIAKAWRDPASKPKLIADPAAALKAESMAVPAGAKIVVHLCWSIILSSTHAKDRAIELGDQTAAPAGKSRSKNVYCAKFLA